MSWRRCNAVLLGPEGRIQCELEPNHDGRHEGGTLEYEVSWPVFGGRDGGR